MTANGQFVILVEGLEFCFRPEDGVLLIYIMAL